MKLGRGLAALFGIGRRRTHGREFILELFPQNSVGAEIGVHMGDFASRILAIVNPKELHLIDPWEYQSDETFKEAIYGGQAKGGQAELDERFEAVQDRFKDGIASGQVRIHRGYSSTVLKQFSSGYFDWTYVDGDHRYEAAKQDLELSFEKTKPGGFISGDDYREGGWWEGGVKRAVDEFVREKQVTVVAMHERQFVLKRS